MQGHRQVHKEPIVVSRQTGTVQEVAERSRTLSRSSGLPRELAVAWGHFEKVPS